MATLGTSSASTPAAPKGQVANGPLPTLGTAPSTGAYLNSSHPRPATPPRTPPGGSTRRPGSGIFHPTADTSTYRDLLLFEERLKMNAEMLRRRRRRYSVFLYSFVIAFVVMSYRLVVLPPENWVLLRGLQASVMVVFITLALFFASGMYDEKIRYAHSYVNHSNRSLRPLNMYFNVRRARGGLWDMLPLPAALRPSPAPLKAVNNTSTVSEKRPPGGHRPTTRRVSNSSHTVMAQIPPSANPRGELIFSSRVDPHFEEGYKRYRSAFERRREERAKEEARQKGPWWLRWAYRSGVAQVPAQPQSQPASRRGTPQQSRDRSRSPKSDGERDRTESFSFVQTGPGAKAERYRYYVIHHTRPQALQITVPEKGLHLRSLHGNVNKTMHHPRPMPTHTPPPATFTPQGPARRRLPGSAARLSTSFSLNPNDSSYSDVSIMSPSRGRAAFLSSAEQGNMSMSQVSPARTPLRRGTANSILGRWTRPQPPGTGTSSRSRLCDTSVDASDELDDLEGDARESMIASMRTWRNDAAIHNLYETAAFWADKILSLTGESNDAFWLAHVYFLMGQYLRAQRLLMDPMPPPRQPGDKDKGKGKEELLAPMIAESLPCRSLAVQCLIGQEKYEEALELIGESNPFRKESVAENGPIDGIKLHSAMCFLRGVLHLRLSSMALAKECFVEALVIDVKNYDAFREIVEGQMMTAAEEWDFVNNLAYRAQLEPEEATFVRLMYLSKLRKDAHVSEIAAVRRELIDNYGLRDNPDVLVGLAEELFARYKWEDCYSVTSRILARIPGHPSALPLHLACMHYIPRLRSSLFMLAHDLVQQDPDAATTWYAVGLWYFTGKRWAEARRHFSKANLIDPRFAPAWIAFAHSFAWEGEHDHAITAYSTAARLFPGSHLTLLFIGMEHLQLSSSQLAEEFFLASAALHPSDPLLLNELGVTAYDRGDMGAAIKYFERAIAGAGEMQGRTAAWAVTHANLGHAYRISGRYAEARAAYAGCIALDPTNATAYASQAMLAQLEGDIRTAIALYHRALALVPQEPVATVLLEMALKEQVECLDPTTLPGLPAAIARSDLDPFNVSKGNPAFGPLPVEADPQTLEEAGGESLMSDLVEESMEIEDD